MHALRMTLRSRILRMSAVWVTFGAVMGATVGMEGGGIFGSIAGMIEPAALGVVFALIGGRPEESVVGALGGLPSQLPEVGLRSMIIVCLKGCTRSPD